MNISTLEEQLSQEVASYPSVVKWRSSPNITEQRHVILALPNDIPNNLIATTLSSMNALPVHPSVFAENTKGTLAAFYYFGPALAGNSGILHGGMLDVLLHECLGRACFPLFPNQVGVTAKLEISYKAAICLPAIVMIQGNTEKVEGVKAWVNGSVTGLETQEVLYATATALFTEPKEAHLMSRLV
jgi:acyl-coenzyme A thioesterase PaaI-like protein